MQCWKQEPFAPGRFCWVDQDHRGGSGQGQCWRCWEGLRAHSSPSNATPGTGRGGQQPEDAGLTSPQSSGEAVSAPWKQVWLCGKCFLVISLPWLFVLQACLHTNWHLLPWLIIHPRPISPWSGLRAPDVTTDRGSDSWKGHHRLLLHRGCLAPELLVQP